MVYDLSLLTNTVYAPTSTQTPAGNYLTAGIIIEAAAATQTITMASTGSTTFDQSGEYNVTASTNDTDPHTLVYTVDGTATDSAGCSVTSAGVVSFTGLGVCTIDVNSGATENYGAAAQAQQVLTVNTTPPPPPPVSPAPPPPPPLAISSQDCSSSSSSGTCSATNDATTASGSGEGSLTVSQYSSDPVGAASFSSASEYFDVEIASGSSFSSLTITDCNLNGGTSIEWWNPQANAGAGAWVPVSPAPSYTVGPPACLSTTLSSTSSPTLAQLTGTVFGVSATVPAAPTNVSATAGNASVTLTWTAPSDNGGSAITGYVITPLSGSAVSVGNVTSDTVSGLTNGTTYTFTVAAINTVGTGPSSAASNSVTPVKATSKTGLKLSATKVTYGHEQVEHLSVTVSPQYSGLTPTGTVTVKDSTKTLCTIKLSSAKGSCTLSNVKLKAGTYSLVATYGGSTNFDTSSSVKEILTVAKATSKTVLKLSATKVTYGDEQVLHLSVAVSPQYSGSPPTGRVTIRESTTTLCTTSLSGAKGSCTLSAKKLKAGTYNVVVAYGGSTNFKGSTSAKESFTVAK
jgi:hypothetical protein